MSGMPTMKPVDIYSCKLYQLVLSNLQSYEKQLIISNRTLRDLIDFNYDEKRKREIISEQVKDNMESIKSYKKQITSFNHCENCDKE